VFWVCGGMALVLVPVLIFALPESYRPTRTKTTIPVGDLFRDGRTHVTALLWFLFFLNLMELYFLTSWLPTTVTAEGISVQWAVIATSLLQFGGAAGALILGPLVDRFGPRLIVGGAFASAAVSVAAIGLAGSSIVITLIAATLCGVGTVGAQNCNNGVAAKFYPAQIRATGVGWALAVGRIGSIVGPVVGGVLLQSGIPNRTLFFVAAVPPLCAALAYVAMGRQPGLRGTRG
jgi:MFS transporter, AAHS family, 4-hydroxybenzoate transporter